MAPGSTRLYRARASGANAGSAPATCALVADDPIEDVAAHVSACSAEIIEGPVEKIGVSGLMLSAAVRSGKIRTSIKPVDDAGTALRS